MSEQQGSEQQGTRPAAIAAGHVAVITGGASGIGLAVAEALIAEGMHVVLADIDGPKLRDVEARLTEDGASVATMVCNTTSEAEVNSLVEFAVATFGGVHLMFNNAGIAAMGDAWRDPMALWHRIVDVNLYGVIHGIRAVLPVMEQQGVGHIVNTASMAGLTAAPGAAPYFATKHAVVGLSESLYIELDLTGSPIGASVLCPGFVKTPLMEKEPETVESPVAQFINMALRAGVDEGIPAADVAAQLVDAVKAGRFWILTHEDMRHLPIERMQRAADGVNPNLAATAT
jgi:NAD(P)-dependent dehydrogenase (short-subunit alcohol dehydrogenase family)